MTQWGQPKWDHEIHTLFQSCHAVSPLTTHHWQYSRHGLHNRTTHHRELSYPCTPCLHNSAFWVVPPWEEKQLLIDDNEPQQCGPLKLHFLPSIPPVYRLIMKKILYPRLGMERKAMRLQSSNRKKGGLSELYEYLEEFRGKSDWVGRND